MDTGTLSTRPSAGFSIVSLMAAEQLSDNGCGAYPPAYGYYPGGLTGHQAVNSSADYYYGWGHNLSPPPPGAYGSGLKGMEGID